MTIHPAPPQAADTAQGRSTAYDTTWTETEMPARQTEPFERVMLSEEKIYVVLAVVLIIWLGLAFFLFRTDRRLQRLERRLNADSSDET